MGFVNRLLPLALVAGWLSLGLLSASTARAGDFFAGEDAAEQGAVLSGSEVWGRVKPQFYGLPTVSFAADLAPSSRSWAAYDTCSLRRTSISTWEARAADILRSPAIACSEANSGPKAFCRYGATGDYSPPVNTESITTASRSPPKPCR